MNIAFFIARKYFFTKRKKNFINVISIVAIVGAALGTAALIIVLSVFNGLEDLLRSLYTSFDPEIKISASAGKSFKISADLFQKIKKVEGVSVLTEVIEDNALVRYAEGQTIIRIKGVSLNYDKQSDIKKALKDGSTRLKEKGINYAVIGFSLQRTLSISLDNEFYDLQIWYPRRQKPASGVDPSAAFNKGFIRPGGVFAIEQEYDEKYLIAPLSFVEELMEYKDKRTSIEVKVKEGFSVENVEKGLIRQLGPKYKIENRDEQHASLHKAIRVEKLFGFLTFSFILAIACLNIFFSLTMLGIEKKKDIVILYSMGCSKSIIRKIFLMEGSLISFSGAGLGLVIGLVICLLQKQYGFVSMGMQTSLVKGYPVELRLMDFVLTAGSIILITFLVSFIPARTASNL